MYLFLLQILTLFLYLKSVTPVEGFDRRNIFKKATEEYRKQASQKQKRSDSADGPSYKIADDESLWELFTTEEFEWVEDIVTNKDPGYFNYSGYNSFEPFRSELYRLEERYEFVTVEKFGKTFEGRELLALHINKNKSENIVFLNSLIHAREWVVGCVTMNIIHRLLEYSTSDAQFLANNYHFIIIPVLNPDGYEYTHTKNRMWRKNREPTEFEECYGVDINRNFLYSFNPYKNYDKEDSPCSETYATRKALSSQEAHGLNFLLFKYRSRIRYYIDYHTFGNLWTYAYGAHSWLPKNNKQLKRYTENVEKSFMSTLGVEWTTGPVFDTIYECRGIVVDHVHYYITPIAFTVEVGSDLDEFTPPDTRIDTYTISQWLALVSQLRLLDSELRSGVYQKEKMLNWRRTYMQKRTVVYNVASSDTT